MTKRGKYIVIEGNDGTGKSTQVTLLAQWLKDEYGINSYVPEEPGGTPIADALRMIIKNKELERDPATNVLLFTAARNEIWKRARQTLETGEWVLSARNYLSTEAYQGHGQGVNLDLIRRTTRDFIGDDYMTPDHTFILTLDDEKERAKRIAARGQLETPDTFESQGDKFQNTVNHAYTQIAQDHGITPIDATLSREEIQFAIRAQLEI